MSKEKKRYFGEAFGLSYEMEFETDEEFLDWFIAKLKKMNPLLPKILDRLLNESTEFTALKKSVSSP